MRPLGPRTPPWNFWPEEEMKEEISKVEKEEEETLSMPIWSALEGMK